MNDITTIAEVARSLSLSRQRIHQMVLELGLRPRRIGSMLLLSPTDVLALQRRHERPKQGGWPKGRARK